MCVLVQSGPRSRLGTARARAERADGVVATLGRVLARRHAADLRRTRVIASVVLAVFLALLSYAWCVLWQWPSAWAWVGALMVTLGVVPFAVGVASWMRVVSLSLVFDRSVSGADDIPYAERERLRMWLTRNLAEVDAALIGLGEPPLESYVELNLASGIARHDPAAARASIERLLAARGDRLDETTRRALERLAGMLGAAAQREARFCLMPVSGWSGLIEGNLRLYLGG